jgi:ABC-type sulfate transport system substrate-binding protein
MTTTTHIDKAVKEADLLKAVFDGFDADIIDTLESEEIDDIANAYTQAASDWFFQELETSAATIADNSGLPSED